MWTRILLAAVIALWCTSEATAQGPQPVIAERFVVVVDAGHGGDNHGCTAFDGQTAEKDVTLALARSAVAAIEAVLPHADVRLTREDDASLTLASRVAQANALGADLFLSIHANASPHHTQTGYETFVLDAQSSSQDAAWTARRENERGEVSPVALGGSTPLPAMMVRELQQAAVRAAAVRFAAALQQTQRERFPSRVDRGVRQAPFDVLVGAQMPAVLFEAGFLDHPVEGAWLLESQTQSEIAAAIAQAVVVAYRQQRQDVKT